MKKARLAIDIGGTFTDFALEFEGRRESVKVLTTPRAPEEGVLAGIEIMLEQAKLKPADIGLIIHGTTLATNAIIERKGAQDRDDRRPRASVIPSRWRSRTASSSTTSTWTSRAPLVPRDLRFGVPRAARRARQRAAAARRGRRSQR